MIRNMNKPLRIFTVAILSFVVGMIMASQCYADSKYAGDYEKCMSAVGSASSIEAVQQACQYAANDNVNGCGLWIGSAASATIPEITVYSKTGTASIKFWGLCTDKVDTTLNINVTNDGDSINDNMNLTRTVLRPSGKASTLDVAKFISGASEQKVSKCETKYTRTVTVHRTHSDGRTTNQMDQQITLIVIDGDGCGDTGKQTCDGWAPASYSSSNMYRGTTTLDFRIKNMASRFGGVGLGAWNKTGPIYAMPTDTIAWTACYYPGVQKTSDTPVTSLNNADFGYTVKPWELPTDRCLPELISVTYEPLYVKVNKVSNWQNQFKMYGDAGTYSGTWTRGDSTIRQNTLTKQTFEGDAGKTFTETAETGTPETAVITQSWPATDFFGCTCVNRWCADEGSSSDSDDDDDDDNNSSEGCRDPREEFYECSCCTSYNIYSGPAYSTGHLNTYVSRLADATVTFGPIKKSLSVDVPYNFTTDTMVEIDRELVYSGSQDAITVNSVEDFVNTRYNSVTIADYATQVPGAETYLYAYVTADETGGGLASEAETNNICDILGDAAKQCVELEYDSRSLNSNGSLGGGSDTIWSDLTYNAFDASAGDWMCFASSVSPSEVDGDKDMSGNNRNSWTISVPACAVIAKKPIFQVWGGSMYSVGNIIAGYNSKVNIYSEYSSDPQSLWKPNGGTLISFMPWVEESLVMKNGLTNSLASGAASALNNNAAHVGTSVAFCNEGAALSFANYSNMIGSFCNGIGGVGQSGIDSGITNREDLIQYWVGTGASATMNTMPGASLDLSNPNSVGQAISSATGITVRYAYSAGDINLSGAIPQGTTYLIKSDGSVNITGNLVYNDSNISFAQIPKVIIYARDVRISCFVQEVDAIIVTKNGGSVDTCAESPYDGSPYAGLSQLKIFGLVIADSVNLKRTYGAAANEDGQRTDSHGIPSDGAAAEIFDYDSSILMWSEFMAGSAESDTLQTVYQHELAPRY